MTTSAPAWAILDGRRVPHEGAAVHVSDDGHRRGFAVFEAFRIERGVPLFLGAQLARLARSVGALGLPLPRRIDGVASDVQALVEANATTCSVNPCTKKRCSRVNARIIGADLTIEAAMAAPQSFWNSPRYVKSSLGPIVRILSVVTIVSEKSL